MRGQPIRRFLSVKRTNQRLETFQRTTLLPDDIGLVGKCFLHMIIDFSVVLTFAASSFEKVIKFMKYINFLHYCLSLSSLSFIVMKLSLEDSFEEC